MFSVPRPMYAGIVAGTVAAIAAAVTAAPLAAQVQTPPWSIQQSGTQASLRGIDSVDGRTAWASGTEGTVLKTIDGGEHWTLCSIPGGDKDGAMLDFRGIQGRDANAAVVMASGPGDKSRLYETTDGCKSWKMVYQNPDRNNGAGDNGFFDSFFVQWSDQSDGSGAPAWGGSVLGDPTKGQFVVLDTVNSGASWTLRTSPELALNGSSLSAFAASNGLFPANQDGTHNPHLFASGGKGGAVVWIEKTEPPAGEHWQRVSVPIAAGSESAGIFAVGARTESVPYRNIVAIEETLVAVGGDYAKPNDTAGTAAWSSDGGQHWTASTTLPHGYRSTVAWDAGAQIWISAGTNGSDFSRDNGKTWQPLDSGNWNAISLPFIVGPKGSIAKLKPDAIPGK